VQVKFTRSHEFLVLFEAPGQNEGETEKEDKPSGMGKGILFPPPNNALNKYMTQMALHGLANKV
jgi:hypothetical protein